MAEETPSNLGSTFGGFMVGRAAGNKRLDETADRLERTLDKFSDTIQRLTTTLEGVSRTSAAPQGSATQQSSTRMGNGGAVSFGGQHAPTSHRADALEPKWTGGGGGGRHVGNGGGFSFGMGNGGHSGGYVRSAVANAYGAAGGRAGIARRVGGAAVAGTAIYTANHYSNQVMGQSIAAQYSYSSDWSQQYRGMGQSYTAANDQDYFASTNMMAQQGGFGLGRGFGEMMSGARGLSYVDPTITNAQATQGILGLGTAGTFNRMAALGVSTMGRNGQVNVNSIARQILQRMNANNIRTPQQVEANFGPAGNATLTVQGMVQNGYIPPQSAQAVLASMRGILKARVGGMGYGEYNRLTRLAGSNASGAAGDAARERLSSVGIQNSMVQQQRANEGLSRDTEGKTIEGFTAGVSQATTALANFRNMLNRALSGPTGNVLGAISGFSGTMPGISSIINRITPFGGGGDGPPSMAGSAMMYASAAGTPGGGMVMGSGPASMSASATQYASGAGMGRKGAPAMGGGIPRGFSLGGVKPWVAKAASILGPKFGIKSMGGVSGRGYASDHPKGLAVDFMCSKGQGDQLAAYAQANAASLNITYIIWYKRIWSVNRKSEGWRPYNSTPDGNTSATALHMDHVHISFLASPTNGDFSNMSSGGGSAAAAGTAMSNAVAATSPGNAVAGGSAALASGFSEAAALGLGGSGLGLGQGSTAAGGQGVFGGSFGGSSGGGTAMGGPADIRTGTYNVHNSTSNAQSKRDLLRLMKGSDVLTLTEMVGKKRGLLDWIRKQGWGVSAGRGDSVNIFDRSDFDMVRDRDDLMNTLTGSRGGTRRRYAQSTLLRDKDSGTEFWQIGAHTVPLGKSRNNALRRRIQQQQFNNLGALAEELGGNVLMAGDFNNRRPNIPGFSSSSGRIDTVLHGSAFGLAGNNVVGGLSSDHAAVLSQFSLGGGNAKGLSGGGPAANMALARAMLQSRGWGGQWAALKNLWMRESGFRTNADNPTSSAYGIPQALTSMHGLNGTKYMTDPRAQIQWGLNYIQNRYGNPGAAWDFWQKNHWYDQGAWNLKEDHDARVHKGEMILPTKVAEAVRGELTAPGMRRGNGGPGIVFQSGAIQVTLQSGNESEARKAGQSVVDAMMEDRRIKMLMGG